MNADTLNSYYNDFVFWMSKSLKSGWGIEMKMYVFPAGAVVAISMQQKAAHHLLRKSDSTSLGEALRKTNLFTEEKIKPIANKSIEKTIVGILSTTKYVLFKNTTEDNWCERAAQEDVENIIKKVKEGYGRQG